MGMTARHPSLRIKGKKIDVRWRPAAGPGPQIYIPFDRPDHVDTAEQALEVPIIGRAYRVINAAGCNITKEVALAAIYEVDLDDVRSAVSEQREARRLRSLPTVCSFVPDYMKHISADERTTSGTREKYLKLLQICWLPKIGHLPLNEVTAKMIDDAMDEMSICTCTSSEFGFWCSRRKANHGKRPSDKHEPGIEKTTRDRYYAAISGLFTYAVKSDSLSASPVKRSQYKPRSLSQYSSKTRENTHFYLTEAQYELLGSKMPEGARLLFRLWGETGMRFSEITGLVPMQIKRKNNIPGIELNEVVKYSKEKGYYRSVPKNKSVRFISLDVDTFGSLLEHAKHCKTNTSLLFTTTDGFRITANNFRRDVWDPAVIAAMRCPDHPPAAQVERSSVSDLVGPTCGDNGGLNARRKPCGFRVKAGTNRCYAHQEAARDAVSECECSELDPPLRLPRRLTPHDLRHTYNSWMQSWGIHQYQMAQRMGHGALIGEVVYGGVPQQAEIALAKRSVRPFSS
jgi:integrase